jgi:hypothetical protein
MKFALSSLAAVGPKRLFATVSFPLPFALSLSKGPCIVSLSNDLSLSKGQAEPVEALVLRAKGFDKLSPNGGQNGASIPQPERFFADLERHHRATTRKPKAVLWFVVRAPRGAGHH